MLPDLEIIKLPHIGMELYTVKDPLKAIKPNACDLYAYFWPAGLLCAEYIFKNRLKGKMLEIGCGNGISGVMALKIGADSVHFTDISKDALDLSKLNCTLNNVENATFDILDWFNLPDYNEKYDYIISSDCLYLSRAFPKLKLILQNYLKRDGMALFVDSGRGLIEDFIDRLDEFTVNRIDSHNVTTLAGSLKLSTTLEIRFK